jgi:threonine dehydrogenase-like Zn-dependent dehydrogenase
VLDAALPPGAVAYVDRDWLPASSGEVPSLVAAPGGALAWCGGGPVQIPGNLDSDAAATIALLVVAEAAAAVLEGIAPDSIEIVGRGLIAQQVRALVKDSSGSNGRSTLIEEPRAIVDTTGDPKVIVDATQRVANLGTVVLLGESLGRIAEMDLYPDVHARGLTLVGVARPLEDAASLVAHDVGSEVDLARELLVPISSGDPLPAGVWYRVSG